MDGRDNSRGAVGLCRGLGVLGEVYMEGGRAARCLHSTFPYCIESSRLSSF